MKLHLSIHRFFLLFVLSSIYPTLTLAENFLINSKSSNFKELETTILNIHKNATAQNIKINIEGDILEHLLDKETTDTIKFDVTGNPATVVLINDKQQTVTIIADHIIYDVESQLVTATNNAKVSWNTSFIKGYKVTYRLDGKEFGCDADETNKNSICENSYTTADFSE